MTRSHDGLRSAAGELEAEAQASAYVRSSPSYGGWSRRSRRSALPSSTPSTHTRWQIVTSLFRKGRVRAATLLAEIGDDRSYRVITVVAGAKRETVQIAARERRCYLPPAHRRTRRGVKVTGAR